KNSSPTAEHSKAFILILSANCFALAWLTMLLESDLLPITHPITSLSYKKASLALSYQNFMCPNESLLLKSYTKTIISAFNHFIRN
ncbi:hypothetical protein BpHYR1_053172, partial [Brachionus plicatilis]